MSTPPVPITVPTTPQMRAALDRLVVSGLFGRTREEVAERLICDRLFDLVDDNWTSLVPLGEAPGEGDEEEEP